MGKAELHACQPGQLGNLVNSIGPFDATVHLLQSHQIRMLLVDDVGDALQIELFVHADTHVDVVSHDSNRGAAKSRA